MRRIQKVDFDCDGRVGRVQWQHYHPKSGVPVGLPKRAFASEVLCLLREGETVGTVFVTGVGHGTPGPNVVASVVDGYEELAMEGAPVIGRSFADLREVEAIGGREVC